MLQRSGQAGPIADVEIDESDGISVLDLGVPAVIDPQ